MKNKEFSHQEIWRRVAWYWQEAYILEQSVQHYSPLSVVMLAFWLLCKTPCWSAGSNAGSHPAFLMRWCGGVGEGRGGWWGSYLDRDRKCAASMCSWGYKECMYVDWNEEQPSTGMAIKLTFWREGYLNERQSTLACHFGPTSQDFRFAWQKNSL